MSNGKKFGLIGYPLGHSLSKPIHEALFHDIQKSGQQGRPPQGDCAEEIDLLHAGCNSAAHGAKYGVYEIHPDDLEGKIGFLKTLDGFNCTIPHKLKIMQYLDHIDERAQFYGAVNTVKNVDGKLHGYNTDWIGFTDALKGLADPKDAKVLLVGAGGVSRMMAYECGVAGAKSIDVMDMMPEVALAMSKEISEKTGVKIKVISKKDLHKKMSDGERYDLILNGSPAGMWHETDGIPVPKAVIHTAGAVFDAIYNPMLTRFLLEAKLAGVPAKGGITMLVGQAAAAQRIWMGVDFSEAELADIAETMRQKMNDEYKMCIVMCGFMGSGKSYVGERLAKAIGYDFVDLDKYIEHKVHKSIPQIFTEDGEAEFRRLECEGLQEIAGMTGVVLALGGGTIILDEAYETIQKLPVRIVFLEVSEEKMFERVNGGEGRPMLNKQNFEENAKRIYHERLPRYHEVSHLTVDADVEAPDLVQQIVEILELI